MTSFFYLAMFSAQSAPKMDRMSTSSFPCIYQFVPLANSSSPPLSLTTSSSLISYSHSHLPTPSFRSLRHCIAQSPLPQATALLLNTLLTLNPPVRARQQAQAETPGETDATPAAAAADAAAAAAGGRLLAALRRSVVSVRSRELKPEDR